MNPINDEVRMLVSNAILKRKAHFDENLELREQAIGRLNKEEDDLRYSEALYRWWVEDSHSDDLMWAVDLAARRLHDKEANQ